MIDSFDSQDSGSQRTRLSESIGRIRKALKVVNERIVNIVGRNNTRLRSPSGKSTTLMSAEEERLNIANRVIGVLNGADKDEMSQFIFDNCVKDVTQSSQVLPPIMGLRDVIIFWVLTFELYPDGIWEQRAIDLKKSTSEEGALFFKIKYSFSGTRIYGRPMKILYEEILAGLRDDEGLDEAMHAVTTQTASMVIRSGTSGSEQDDVNSGNGSGKSYELGDTAINHSFFNVENRTSSNNPSFSNTLQLNAPVSSNTEEQAELDFEQRLINGEDDEDLTPINVNFPCAPLECHGIIWLGFNEAENKIVSIEVDVDIESEHCDKDVWIFTPPRH